jgi:hypothetical protein
MPETALTRLVPALGRAGVRYRVTRGQDELTFGTDDPAIAAWPVDYLAPGCRFEPLPAGAGPATVTCAVDPGAVETLRRLLAGRTATAATTYEDRPVRRVELDGAVALAYTDRPGVTVVAAGGRQVGYLAADVADARFEAARLVREVLRRRGEDRGEVVVHAGAVLLGGAAWIVCGPKGAGKTTTVCALLEHLGADFVANDRVHLDRSGAGFAVTAWPMSTRIGLGTCLGSARLRPWLRPRRTPVYPQTGWDPAAGIAPAAARRLAAAADAPKIELVTSELVASMGAAAAAGGPLAGLLLPTRRPDLDRPQVRSGTPDRAARLLLDQSFTPDDDAYPDWLGLRSRPAAELARDAHRLLADLSRAVPVLDVAFAESVSLAAALRPVLRKG